MIKNNSPHNASNDSKDPKDPKDPLEPLIKSLMCLPGVGVKTARRYAYHLMQKNMVGAQTLAQNLNNTIDNLQHCSSCNTFSLQEICPTCANAKRDHQLLCIVETPYDRMMIENTNTYQGLYYVLMGKLEPTQGVGPTSLSFKKLAQRALDGTVEEVIIATSFTNTGDLAAHYIQQMLSASSLKITRFAQGLPAGADLEYIDSTTLARALRQRIINE